MTFKVRSSGLKYVALGEKCITLKEFDDVHEQAKQKRATILGFINYLTNMKNKIFNLKNCELWTHPGKRIFFFCIDFILITI